MIFSYIFHIVREVIGNKIKKCYSTMEHIVDLLSQIYVSLKPTARKLKDPTTPSIAKLQCARVESLVSQAKTYLTLFSL